MRLSSPFIGHIDKKDTKDMSKTIEPTKEYPDHDHDENCDCESEFEKLQEMELDAQ